MYEYREIRPEELPEGATGQDLMNMGLFEVSTGIYHCISGAADNRGQRPHLAALPGQLLAGGRARHRLLPKDVRTAVLHARVVRHHDAKQSLRHMVNDNQDPERLRAAVPARGGSRKPASESKALQALSRAKALAESGEALNLLVPMAEVQDGDVVEYDMLPSLAFDGEVGLPRKPRPL